MALGRVTVFAGAGAPADGPMAAQLHLGVGRGRCGRWLGGWWLRGLGHLGPSGAAGHRSLISGLAQGAQIIHLAHRRFTWPTLAGYGDSSRQAPRIV